MADGLLSPDDMMLGNEDVGGYFMTPAAGLLGGMYETMQIPAKVYRGDYGVGSVNNPAFMQAAQDFTIDYGVLPAVGGAVIAPSANTLRMGANLPKELIQQILRNQGRNPKKVAKELRQSGLLDLEQSPDFIDEFKTIRSKRDYRRANAPREDSLLFDQATRERRLKQFKKENEIKSAPIFSSWSKPFQERVLGYSDISDLLDEEARLATLEAIAREAKKRGLKVYRTSKSKSNRASSRYIELPSGARVRISDHDLPMTAEREYKRSIGVGNFADDIVVDNWDTTTLDEYMDMIMSADEY